MYTSCSRIKLQGDECNQTVNPISQWDDYQSLNPVADALGTPIMIYDQNMMDEDLGKYTRHPTQPKMITLEEGHNAKCIEAGQIVFNMITGECVIIKLDSFIEKQSAKVKRLKVRKKDFYRRCSFNSDKGLLC